MLNRALALPALLALASTAWAATPTITAPPASGIGAPAVVTITGTTNPRDFVSIVPKAGREGSYGDYGLHVFGASRPYSTLARRRMCIVNVIETLECPAEVAASARTCPVCDRDRQPWRRAGEVEPAAARGQLQGLILRAVGIYWPACSCP